MDAASLPEALAGGALLFFVPGYAVTKALFPEWRIRGRAAARRLVEIVTLSFVLSVTLTLLLGYLLLAAAPGGFQASWSDPVLEAALAGVTVIALAAGGVRGSYRREPPTGRPWGAEPPVEDGLTELTERLEALGREERRLVRSLRSPGQTEAERSRLTQRLHDVRAEAEDLGRRREAEYAG